MATVTDEAAGATGLSARIHPPLSIWEFLAAATCVLVNLLDGFDILIMSVAAPSIGTSLGLSTQQIGLVFSSGLAGMMIGALLLSQLSDRLGRRTVIVACLIINIAGVFATGLSHTLGELMTFRFITGLGVGGMMPVVNTAIAEVVHASRRSLAVIVQCAAYPAGGLFAAVAWPMLIDDFSWRQIIQASCLPSIVCLTLVLLFLPETNPFLLSRRPPDALARVNRTLRRYKQPLLDSLPPPEVAGNVAVSMRAAFSGPLKRNLLALSLVTFLAQFSFYFFVSWLPAVMVSSLPGFKASGAVLLNLGGIAGGLILAGLALLAPLRRLTSGTMYLGFISIAALAFCLNAGALTLSLAALVGAALFALMAGIYGIAPNVFPTSQRAGGLGVAFSVGRFGGVLSPYLGAMLMGVPNVSLQASLILMAAPLAAAGLALGFIRSDAPARL